MKEGVSLLSVDWDMCRTDWELESQGRLSWDWKSCSSHSLAPVYPTPCRWVTSGPKRKELEVEKQDCGPALWGEGGESLWVRP